MNLLEFAVSEEFFFDRAVGRHRYRDSKQFAPRTAILALTRDNIEQQKHELVALGDRLSSNDLTLREFQQQAGALLRRIHTQSALLGKGGIDQMTSSDWLAVGRTLKTQYRNGYDKENNRRFGLKWLCQDIINGKVSPAQLRNRLDLYGKSGILSYYAAERQGQLDKGLKEGKRILADSDRSCPECYAYAGLGWVSLSRLVLPTQRCSCKNRCRCVLEYR